MSADHSPGTCFGFAVRSTLPFAYLRSGAAGAQLEVSAPSVVPEDGAGELLMEWTPSPRFPLAGRLLRAEPGFRLWVETWGWFLVDPERGCVTLPDSDNVVRREERLWSIPAMLCLIARGDASLHAAAVEVDGQAIILAAPGTFGKTTLAAAFHAAGHRLLSEDTTCLRASEPPFVVPGPAMLRLRHDVAEQLDIPNATSVGTVDDDRVHLALDPTRRGDCSPVAVRAVVLLRHADDGVRIEPVAPADAVRDLWSLSFRLPSEAEVARSFMAIADLVRSVPVWNLYRPLTIRDLPAAVDCVVRHA